MKLKALIEQATPLPWTPGKGEPDVEKRKANNPEVTKPTIPEEYPPELYRQVPDRAVGLVERTSQDGRWIDLLAVMPEGSLIYVTTKPSGEKEEA